MTVVRLTRMGRKKRPFYRIVVTDSRKRRDGGWIESIGYYNPMVEPEVIKFDAETPFQVLFLTTSFNCLAMSSTNL